VVPTTLMAIYALLAAFGLVVTDTYVNADTMYLDTTVATAVAEESYEASVVNDIFISEVKKITKTPSLIAAPLIQSSKTKPISTAFAQFANMEPALEAIQSLLGVIPPKMTTSLIIEDEKQRVQIVENAPDGRVAEYVIGDEMTLKLVLTGYDPNSGYFDIQIKAHSADDDFDHLIRDAAFRAVLQLDPYLALLYDLNKHAASGEDLAPTSALLEKEIAIQPETLVHASRALLENMRGILALLANNTAVARADFEAAIGSNPKQPVGYLNLAFLEVHEDRYQKAIETVEKVIYPSYWPMTSDPILLATGYIIKGVAETEMEQYQTAETSFQKAATLHPQSSEVFVYWARMLRRAGRPAEAEQRLRQARENTAFFENFPEMALMYIWLTEEGEKPMVRRTSIAETL